MVYQGHDCCFHYSIYVRLFCRTSILRIHLDTLEMKIHHTGRLRDFWVHQKLGKDVVDEFEKHGIELQYEEAPCRMLPHDRFKTVTVYAIVNDPKLAFWFKLKGH